MMMFYDLPSGIKTCLISLMLLLNLFQFCYVALLTQHKKKQAALFHIIFLLILGMSIPFLAENLYLQNDIGRNLNAHYLVLFYFIIWPVYMMLYLREFRRGKGILGKNAVKEAVDKLPVAICFFSLDGIPVLCNMAMYSLAYDLLGKDLQTVSELKECLNAPNKRVKRVYLGEEPCFLLVDQSVWHFARTDVQDVNGKEYIQVIGTDVTNLYQLQQELDERNDELKEMLSKLQKVSENIADIVRSKELLDAKERVHGKMGSALLMVRRFITETNDKGDKNALRKVWKDTLQSLRNEMDEEDDNSAFDELIQIAKGIGVDIQIEGSLPEDERAYELITCGIREMLTNTVRHAGGHQLHLSITYVQDKIKAIYTNDGICPTQEIIEGGGLTMLRKRVEEYHGTMMIKSNPRFSLEIIVNRQFL